MRINDIWEKQEQQVLFDEKWKKFMRRNFLWRHAPFVEFVLGAGSMALGTVHENSDFDVVVGARVGRIFTARFFSALFFGVFGWRRSKIDHHEYAMDKICLNHFVTIAAYKLDPPYNDYWRALYKKFIPIFGSPEVIDAFFVANEDWLGEVNKFGDDLRYRGARKSWGARAIEFLLLGRMGNVFERFLKRIQVRRIERGLSRANSENNLRISYSDSFLEFHTVEKEI